jgi:hypothetical protein
MPRNLACLMLACAVCQTRPAGAEPSAADTLLAHGVREIVFAERSFGPDGHWYANFGYYFNGPQNAIYGRNGRLLKLDVKTNDVTTLLEDRQGAVRDPQVHYDGRKILFSYRPGETAQFHLYEINVDGTGLKQLTDGIYDDIEPCYLPDGGIVFVSSRSKRWVQCWQVQVATLHRCDGDGKNIRPLSANVEMDNTPWVLPDGRIIYMRWEYVDRSQVEFHHLWTCNPDGTNQTVYYGNMHPTSVFIDAKPIPGTDKVLFIDSPGHGKREHAGFVSMVSEKHGPDDLSAKRRVSSTEYRDPYPISDDCFIAATNNGIDVLDGSGRASRLFTFDGTMHEPRPLIKRPRERIIPSRIDPSKATGTLVLDNVYVGRNMEGVEKGQIKNLLVLETLPKPLNYGTGMHDFIPISHGGTFTLERILGTVPVEPDGSAHFELPANRPWFLIALDENKAPGKIKHSFLTVMPGEVIGCVGCHEKRANATLHSPAGTRLAMRRKPSRIAPVPGLPDMIDFPRHIQPILDAHCVECHNPDKPEGRVLLNGDHGSVYSISYFTLTSRGLVSDGRNRRGNTAPRAVGDSASRLMTMLDHTHYGAKLSQAEIEMIRNWIHVGAPYPGTSAALGTGMVRHNNLPPGYGAAWREAQAAHERRCAKCHRGLPALERYSIAGDNNEGLRNTHLAYNLTRPEKSPMLLAPLARRAGGWGMQKHGADGKPAGEMVEVFQDTNDPDYRAILDYIEMGRLCLEQNKRWDMPGFKPHPFYVREMKRYGILPETFDSARDDIDVFQIDRRYWESTWHYPDGSGPAIHANEKLNQKLISPAAAADIAEAGRIEGESLKVVRCDGGRHWVQELRYPSGQWSGNKHLIWANGKQGQSIAIEFAVADAAQYAITLRMTKARDYGVFQLYLDGEKLGQPIDLFSPNVEPADPITFDARPLANGMHTLRVEAIGTNSDVDLPHRVGIYLFGLDYLVLNKK